MRQPRPAVEACSEPPRICPAQQRQLQLFSAARGARPGAPRPCRLSSADQESQR